MNVNAMRRADRWLGWPLCGLLTVVRGLVHFWSRGTGGQMPQRVLVIKMSEMGSTVLAWPALAQLRRRLPHAQLHVLTFAESRDVFDALAPCPPEQIVTVDTRSPWRLLVSGLGAIRHLRRQHIDTVLDMDFFSRFTAALAYLICPRGRRVGFDRFTNEGQGRGRLLTHPLIYSPHIHTAAAFMALVEGLFTPHPGEVRLKQYLGGHDYSLPQLRPAPDAVTAVTQALGQAGVDSRRAGVTLVLVNPNSSAMIPQRRWPAMYFIAFCRQLLELRPDVHIAVTGGAAEREEAEGFVTQVGQARCVNFAGCTSFPELLALYTLARLMVTNDSGPAHFAALTPLPTLVLFGPETPRLYGPLAPTVHPLYAQFACSPCVSVYNGKKSPCQHNRCLQAITVEDVLREALARLPPAPATQLGVA